MKKLTTLLALLVLPVSAAMADYSYDWRTGNSYNTSPSYNGGTQVQGYNSNTGSSWQTRIDRNGNMNGTDSKGNYWNYDKSTGNYWNTNGKICTGKGAYRVCN